MANTSTYSASPEQTIDEARLTSVEELRGEPEPWEPWETKLVLYSIGLALVGLVILGFLVNTFILS
ncbi:MAG: hypothetical protein PVJ39_01340 [Gammaproteobacteria bacterium]|jgi:hypothetical protein